MIDIENDVFNIVATKLREQYPKLFITGEYTKAPPSFPCVSLIEMDNVTLERTQTSSCNENHVQVMYEANVYSNKRSGKKAECREIAAALDDAMLSIGFSRVTLNVIPNMNDATIYRIVSRYRAVVSKEKLIYRR